jgi:hypothetical protein
MLVEVSSASEQQMLHMLPAAAALTHPAGCQEACVDGGCSTACELLRQKAAAAAAARSGDRVKQQRRVSCLGHRVSDVLLPLLLLLCTTTNPHCSSTCW